MAFLRDLFEVFKRYARGLALAAAILIIVLVAATVFLSVMTHQSSTCDSCHYMDPYVRHWETSSHAGVDCIECHDYGAGSLAASTFKYVTGTYTTRPKAVVPDDNCMGSECHDMETLDQGKTFKQDIVFQHSVHLGRQLRSEVLRCTSCHNQIVQYDDDQQGHMTVNDKACFVCHFKDAGMGEAITGCNSCHGMPKTEVEHEGFVFDHEPYLQRDVECKQCHVQVVQGDGSVPDSKCYSCHVERTRQDYSREELHAIHVTTNGIDCYECHTDIEHGNFAMVGALETQCESCHVRQHNKQKQLYMGIGGKADKDMPSEMFAAQVSCSGCHTHLTPEGEPLAEQEKREASRNSCVSCHGEKYDLMFDNWSSGVSAALGDYRSFLSAAKSHLSTAGGTRQSRTDAQSALSKAEHNYSLIREGHMQHNIWYALYLMNSSAEKFQESMRQINKLYKAPDLGSARQDKSCVTFCHGRAFRPEFVDYDGSELPHEFHVTEFEIACKSCHSTTEHGKTNIDQSVCSDCH